MNYFDSPIVLDGIGEKKLNFLHNMGIKKNIDFLFHFPFRYDDWTTLDNIDRVDLTSEMVYFGELVSIKEYDTYRGKKYFKANITSNQGNMSVLWFNQGWLKQSLKIGRKYIFFGKLTSRLPKNLIVRDFYKISNETDLQNLLCIQPVYLGTKQLSSEVLRKFIDQVLTYLIENPLFEILSSSTREKYDLTSFNKAMLNLHRPQNITSINKAKRSMIIYEWLIFLSCLDLNQKDSVSGFPLNGKDDLFWEIVKKLPFSLTNAQKKVIKEIKNDLESSTQMKRLLQGDVGSGKTLVAMYVLMKALSSGGQSAMIAPTELLAQQHYNNLKILFKDANINLSYYSSHVKGADRDDILAKLRNGEIDIVIGTHALLEPRVLFNNLKTIVIDEQHRFGVKQREALYKKGELVDSLIMTATPIPRSLALSVYGNLKHSVIDELPLERKKIESYWITDKKKKELYKFIYQHLKLGEQAFFICPLIEKTRLGELKNVEVLTEELKNYLSPFEVQLLHGRMNTETKHRLMQEFLEGKIKVLVSTTVIEVGIDVPNASIMVIENAERFGLAQLHQLRGRVGRGSLKSYAFFVSNNTSEEVRKRMEIIVKSKDGFQIAEEDLKLRGPGEFIGLKQHGLPMLNLANFKSNIDELIIARKILNEESVNNMDFYIKYYMENIAL